MTNPHSSKKMNSQLNDGEETTTTAKAPVADWDSNPWYPQDVTFDFRYAGWDFLNGYTRPDVGHCKVRIKYENNTDTYHIRIHEPRDTGTVSVTNWIEHIATGIYWSFLTAKDPRRITWTIHYEAESAVGSKAHDFPCALYWDGTQFHYNLPQKIETRPKAWNLRDWYFEMRKAERENERIKPFVRSPEGNREWRKIWDETDTEAPKGGAA
jgi:hypothetical protein